MVTGSWPSRRFRPSWAVAVLTGLLIAFSKLTTASPTHQIHHKFARETLQQIFQVDNHEDVPEYDVVRVRSISKRDTSEMDAKHVHVSAFGRKYRLRLERNPHLAESAKRLKVLVADVKNGKVSLAEDSSANVTSPEVGEPYHDVVNMAAVTIHHDSKGTLRMASVSTIRLDVKMFYPR